MNTIFVKILNTCKQLNFQQYIFVQLYKRNTKNYEKDFTLRASEWTIKIVSFERARREYI